MDFLRNSRKSLFTTRLAAMVLFFLVSFSVYGLYCFNTVTAVKINGSFYKRIIQGKDVIADVLPPPAYLIETFLTAFQMVDADTAALPALEAKFLRLRDDYLARQAYWSDALEESVMKRLLVERSFLPGKRLLDAFEHEFIPALKAGNRQRAIEVLSRTIQPEYAAHRAAIDQVVELALKRHREDEASAAVAVKSRTYGQIALGILLFFTLTVVSGYAVQKSDPVPLARSVQNPAAPPDARLISTPGQIREST